MGFRLRDDVDSIDPWCAGSSRTAQHCVEAELFRGWQHDAAVLAEPEEQLQALLQHTNGRVSGSSESPSTSNQPQDRDSSIVHITYHLPHATPAERKKGLNALQSRLFDRLQQTSTNRTAKYNAWKRRQRTKNATALMKEWHNMSTLSRDLKALHDSFDARLAQRRASTEVAKDEWENLTAWAREVEALQHHFSSHFSDSPTTTVAVDNMTPWSRDLVALQHRMEARMHELDEAHEESSRKHPHVHQMTLLEQITSVGAELCTDPLRRDSPHCAQFSSTSAPSASMPSSAGMLRHAPGHDRSELHAEEAELEAKLQKLSRQHHEWEESFSKKIASIGRDLCADPQHRRLAACVRLLTPTQDAAPKASHDALTAEIAEVGRELCSNPVRHSYLACQQFDSVSSNSSNLMTDEAAEINVDGEDFGKAITDHIDLHWEKVPRWQSFAPKRLRGSATAKVLALTTEDVSELRTSAHWNGRIPSVACISLVPKGSAAKAWLHFFIENFRLQNYEGAHQLILVYHHSDDEAADLVRKYADSSNIHFGRALGEDFPSTTAFRYGAWLAKDADIIARWDFGAWHHPQRLSAQVQALAFSGRPACLLKQWTLLDSTGANVSTVEGINWDSSLVGEAAWMRSNWYPLMGRMQNVSDAAAAHLEAMDEHNAFNEKAARDLVTVETKGLEVFDEAWRW
jgi:hypothetical protein